MKKVLVGIDIANEKLALALLCPHTGRWLAQKILPKTPAGHAPSERHSEAVVRAGHAPSERHSEAVVRADRATFLSDGDPSSLRWSG